MRKLARFLLIWIIFSIASGAVSYIWLNNNISPMYSSTAKIYVITGSDAEGSLRATDGGLKDDFAVVLKSESIIADAKRSCGTSEDIASYITINTPPNSNIVEVICTNPDQTTAKKYADAVARSACKVAKIIPVENMSVLVDGTSTGVSFKPELFRKAGLITLVGSAGCFTLELIVLLFICSFAKKKDDDDDEAEYNRYYGNVVNYNDKSSVANPYYKANNETAATETQNVAKSNYSNDEEDFLIDEDIIDEDDLLDEDQESTSNKTKHSSEVIGKIPR